MCITLKIFHKERKKKKKKQEEEYGQIGGSALDVRGAGEYYWNQALYQLKSLKFNVKL